MTTNFDSTTIWIAFFAIGIATYGLRVSIILLFGRIDELPSWVGGVLRFVPPAVLAALVVPAILSLTVTPSIELVFEPARVIAATLATLVAWETKNVLATIGAGMVALWALQVVLY
jgi:branched-subunit amino acid transport protein